MSRIAVAGYGAVGRAVVAQATERGDEVRVIGRHEPAGLPKGAVFHRADMMVPESAANAVAGVDNVVLAVGIPYATATFVRDWPVAMRNTLGAVERGGNRLVFADNLYMYGPQTRPLTEDMPLTDYGQKPKARAEITRLWQTAHAEGRVRATAVRAADFYGPNAATSVLSAYGIARMVEGRPALIPFPTTNPHDFTYVPDFARALLTLVDAEDDAYGEAWHVPNAKPTQTPEELLKSAAELIGTEPRIRVMPASAMTLIGVFNPIVRSLREMRFQWDRPYVVDSSKFASRFWGEATPYRDGIASTIESYRRRSSG